MTTWILIGPILRLFHTSALGLWHSIWQWLLVVSSRIEGYEASESFDRVFASPFDVFSRCILSLVAFGIGPPTGCNLRGYTVEQKYKTPASWISVSRLSMAMYAEHTLARYRSVNYGTCISVPGWHSIFYKRWDTSRELEFGISNTEYTVQYPFCCCPGIRHTDIINTTTVGIEMIRPMR